MNENRKDVYLSLLETFDKLELKNMHERRTAYKPLYDYFQKLVLQTGFELCGLDPNSLRNHPLGIRWKKVSYCLSCIEDPKGWDSLIGEIHNIRMKVEHNDYFYPKQQRLIEVRNKATEFKDWLFRVGNEYHKKSPSFTFKEWFTHLANYYLFEAEFLEREFGEHPDYARNISVGLEILSHEQLCDLVRSVKERLQEITKLEDIERSDLENLIKIVSIISQLKGREETLLRFSVCPKCGGRIKETEHYVGTGEAGAAIYRVGCEECDYELHSETFSI